jgi:dipeptidyl-peptidase-4
MLKRPLTIKDIFAPDVDWNGPSLQCLNWVHDGASFLYIDVEPENETKVIYQENINGERKIIVDSATLTLHPENTPISITDFQTTKDCKYFLIKGSSTKPLFRFATPPKEGIYYIFNTDKKKLKPLSSVSGSQKYAKLSPDGKKVCFVRDGNLFKIDLETEIESQLTYNEDENILNGLNKGFGEDGWCWSPDSKKILFVQVDQTLVDTIPLVDYMTFYPTIHKIKYPKSGETNWKLRLGIINLETDQTSWLKLGPEMDVYFPRFKWTRDPALVAIERLNRIQNNLDLIFVNVNTGDSRVVFTETDPFWVRIDDDLTFFKNSDHFIWTSQRSGYNHAYLYDYNGHLIHQITKGNWEINAARSRYAIIGLDESDGWLYFEGKKDGVIEQHIYRVKIDGKEIQRLSTGSGWHAASLSPDTKHFIKTFSDVNTPPRISLHKSDGTFIRWIKEEGIPELINFEIAHPEFLVIQTSDGLELNAVMLKPVDFNPGRKYPVIFYAYGGISSQTVVNRWGGARWLWHQYMTQKGYIVFTIDNRGTGGRGKVFENYMYQNLGTVPLLDQIEGAKYLASLQYIDSSCFGIWGRSAGGYLTCLALTEGSDYFKVGVAHASVTNYRFYSSVWAERYMGLPQENQSAYDKEAVVTYAHKLNGNLMLVHGMADDNVQLQNTLEVSEAFHDANKQFDLMLYHGCDHSLKGGNTQLHLFTLMAEYFLRHLPPR